MSKLNTSPTLAITSGRVREEVNRLAGQPHSPGGELLLDFRDVEWVGSEDLGALVVLNKKVKGAGGRLELVNVRPMVSEVLAVTRLDTILTVRPAA